MIKQIKVEGMGSRFLYHFIRAAVSLMLIAVSIELVVTKVQKDALQSELLEMKAQLATQRMLDSMQDACQHGNGQQRVAGSPGGQTFKRAHSQR